MISIFDSFFYKAKDTNSITNFFGDNHFTQKSLPTDLPDVLHKLLPYRYYDKDNKLYYNQIESDKEIEETSGFILKATPVVGCSEAEIDILANFFNDNLPEGLILQITNYASPRVGNIFDLWQKKRHEEGGVYKDLANKRVDYLNNGRWKSLFPSPFVTRDFEIYISASLSKKNNKNAELILTNLRETFISNLKNVNINTSIVEPDNLLSFLDEVLSPKKSQTHKSRLRWDQLNPINIQLSDSESKLNVESDSLELADEVFAKSFSVKSYPEIWGGWEMINLLGSEYRDSLRISCPFMTSLTIHVPNFNKSKGKAVIKDQVLEPRSKGGLARFWQNVGNMAKDWKYVVDHLNKGHRLVSAKFTITLFAAKEDLSAQEERLKAIYVPKGWSIKADNYFHLPSFLSSLPFYTDQKRFETFKQLGKTRTMLSWTCANIAPLQGEFKGALAEPCVMLLGKRGQPLYWNPYYSPEAGGNYNVVVTGKSGSGKSVFIQDLAASIRGVGGQLFVIDNGESFKNSSAMQGGKFIKIDKNICISPFTMFDLSNLRNDLDYRRDVLNFFTCLISQICRPITPINEDERALITLATEKVLDQHEKNGSLELISEALLEVTADEFQMRAARSLKLSLDVFLKKYGKYFRGTSDITMESKMMIFEMSNLEGGGMEDLKSVVMMIIMHLITELIYKGDRSTRSALMIDEAWTMLQGEGMKKFIEGYVRRVRKFGGSLVTASQSINDYYANPAAKAVLDNSQWKIFLAQNKDAIDYLKENKVIGMSSQLEEALKNVRMVSGCYSEVLVYGDSGWYVGRLLLDKFSIFLYSSKAEEVAALERYKKQGFTLEESINKLIEGQ